MIVVEESNGITAGVQSKKDAVELLVQELNTSLKSPTVITPDSEGYAESIRRWSDAVEKRAAIVVYVGSAEDIASTVRLAQKFSVPFVVAGGKHFSGGASSTEGGLVIDLAKMRRVIIDESTKTARVQGGCLWKDVDEAAGAYGLATVGGTVNHTGVGGLTLGGGYGWLSGRHGLTIDNLLEVQIVLGDGSIEIASKDKLPDLFWAVRGAGHCFGVVVEFTFQLHEQQNPVWSGQLIFPASTHLEGVVSFANDLLETTNCDSAIFIGITVPPFMIEPAVVATVFHNGPKEAALQIFQALIDMQPLRNTTNERLYSEVNGMMNHAVDYGGRKVSKGASFATPIQADFIRRIITDLEHLHRTVPGSKRSILLFEFIHHEMWCKIPRDETAFANRGRHQNFLIGPFWNDAVDDQTCRLWASQTAKKARLELERVKTEAGDTDLLKSIGEYGNYDGLSANARDIFGSNFERLCEIKTRYDPDNVFDKSYALLNGEVV